MSEITAVGDRAGGAQPSRLVLHLATVDVSVRHLLLPQLLFLQQAGYTVAAASNPGPGAQAAEEAGISFIPVPMSRVLFSFNHVSTVWRLVRLLRARKVHILHVHTPVAAALGRVAGWIARTPVVFYTAHGFYFHEHMPRHVGAPLVLLEKVLGRLTNHLFCQSAEDHETAVTGGIAAAERASYLGNGVDVALYAQAAQGRAEVRRELGLTDEPLLAFTGRFVREKGVAELLEATLRLRETHPDLRLLVIGASLSSDRDPVDGRLIELTHTLATQGVLILTGFTDRVAEYLGAADIFVLPSYREGMPRSILEAMASGLPVVATDIRGCREEVVDGVTGYLVPIHDAVRLAEQIDRLLEDDQLRERMGAAGQQRARESFEEKLVFERLLEVYRRYLPVDVPARATID